MSNNKRPKAVKPYDREFPLGAPVVLFRPDCIRVVTEHQIVDVSITNRDLHQYVPRPDPMFQAAIAKAKAAKLAKAA